MLILKKLTNIIESVLFVSGDAVSAKDIAEKTGVSEKDVLNAAKELQKKYEGDSGVQLLIFNKKLQFCSNPEYADAVSGVLNPIKERELSRSMLEVAAIIAYKQPVTRLDLEELRGCNSEYALQNLLKLGIIEVVGRKDAIGKPALFGTTDEFLKRFQISDLNELPDYDELMCKIAAMREPEPKTNYLFEKPVYNPETDGASFDSPFGAMPDAGKSIGAGGFDGEVELNGSEVHGAVDAVSGTGSGKLNESDAESLDLSEEEIPDFLKDEDVQVIN